MDITKMITSTTTVSNFFLLIVNNTRRKCEKRRGGSAMELRGRSQTTLTIFCHFLTTYPPDVYILYLINVDKKNQHFWTTYLPFLVNVACKRPLSRTRTCRTEKKHNFCIGEITTAKTDWVQGTWPSH